MDTPMEIGFFFWPYTPALIRKDGRRGAAVPLRRGRGRRHAPR